MYQSLTCLTSQLLYLLFCSKYKVHSVRTGYFLHFESVWIILNHIEIWITAYGFQKKCITEYGYKFKFPQNMDNAHILKFRFFWKTRKTFPNKIWLKRKPYEGGGLAHDLSERLSVSQWYRTCFLNLRKIFYLTSPYSTQGILGAQGDASPHSTHMNMVDSREVTYSPKNNTS